MFSCPRVSVRGECVLRHCPVKLAPALASRDEHEAVHRCAAVLQRAARGGHIAIITERFRGLRPRLDLVQTRSVKYAYLEPDGEGVALRLYAGDTLEQARVL